MIALSLSYLYFHQLVQKADFYKYDSPGALHAVINFNSINPIQYRILVPFVFKGLSLLTHIPDKPLFLLIIIANSYLILLSFYFLLNRHFKDKAINCWLAPVIMYPMLWNLVILNGQFFYMDFAILLLMITGYYFIVSERYNWLLVAFFIGMLNHTAISYLIISFLLYNYKKLFHLKTIVYTLSMVVMFFVIPLVIDSLLPKTPPGAYLIFNLPRNINAFFTFPKHLLVRDLLLVFGGLHFLVILYVLTDTWKKFKSAAVYINLLIIPYLLSLWLNLNIDEMRNYAPLIPNVIIVCLLYLSTFENSFLKTLDAIKTNIQS